MRRGGEGDPTKDDFGEAEAESASVKPVIY
jgi:hypothetical protein